MRLVFWLIIHQGVLFVMLDLETASTEKGHGFVSCFVCMGGAGNNVRTGQSSQRYLFMIREEPKVKKRWIRHDKKQEGEKKTEWRLGRRGRGGHRRRNWFKKKKVFSLPGVRLSLWLGGIWRPTFPLWPYIKPRGNKRQEHWLVINITFDTIPPFPEHI